MGAAYACSQKVKQSCIIHATRSSDLDLSFSFRILWSAVSRSANSLGSGRPSGRSPALDLQKALFTLHWLQMGHFPVESLGKCVKMLCSAVFEVTIFLFAFRRSFAFSSLVGFGAGGGGAGNCSSVGTFCFYVYIFVNILRVEEYGRGEGVN